MIEIKMDRARGINIGEVLSGRKREATLMLGEMFGQLPGAVHTSANYVIEAASGAAVGVANTFTGWFGSREVIDESAIEPQAVSPGFFATIADMWPYSAASVEYQGAMAQTFVAERNAAQNYTDSMLLMSRSPTGPSEDTGDSTSIFMQYREFFLGLYDGYHNSTQVPDALNDAIVLSDEETVKQDPLKYYFSMLLVIQRLNLDPNHFPIEGVFNKSRGLARRVLDSIVSSPQTQAVIAPILNNPAMLHHLVRLVSAIDADVVEKIVKGEELNAEDCLVTDAAEFDRHLEVVLPESPISAWLNAGDLNECNEFWRVVANGVPKVLGTDDKVIATLETAALIKRLPECFRTVNASFHVDKLMELLSDVMPAGDNRENIRAIHSGYVRLFQDEARNGYRSLFEGLEQIDINTIEAMINAQNAFNGVVDKEIDPELLDIVRQASDYEVLPEGFKGMAMSLRGVPRDQLSSFLNLMGQAIPSFKEGSQLHATFMLAMNASISSSIGGGFVETFQKMLDRGLGQDAYALLQADPAKRGIANAIEPLLQRSDGSRPLKAYMECLTMPWEDSDGNVPLKTFESMIGAAWVYSKANDGEKELFTNLSNEIVQFANGGDPEQKGGLVNIATNLQSITENLPDFLISQAISLVPPPVSKWKSFKTALSYLFQAFIHNEEQAKARFAVSGFLVLMFVFALSAAILPFIFAMALAGTFLLVSVVLGCQYLYKAYRMSSDTVAVHTKVQDYVFESILGITDDKEVLYQKLRELDSADEESKDQCKNDLHAFIKEKSVDAVSFEQRILLASHALARGLAGEDKTCTLLSEGEREDVELKEHYSACHEKAVDLRETIMNAKVDLKVVGVPLLGKMMQWIPKGEFTVSQHAKSAEQFLWGLGDVASSGVSIEDSARHDVRPGGP